MKLQRIAPEAHSIIEHAQFVCWILACLIAAASALRQRFIRGKLLAFWLGTLSLLAALRELDMHVALNPENIHLLGVVPENAVRFRLDWWLDPATPGSLRLVWAAIFLATFMVLILPLAFARYSFIKQCFRGDVFARLMLLGLVLLAASYLLEEFVVRHVSKMGIRLDLLEEWVETMGQWAILAGLILLAFDAVPDLRSTRKTSSVRTA